VKLAVSNIAWPAERRDEAYAVLAQAGITGLEVAPGLLLADAADPFDPTSAEVAAIRLPLERAGLRLVSMQSLLFGVADAALFEGQARHARFCAALERAIRLAGLLEIPNVVFGSPRQRAYPAEYPAAEAEAFAADTFRVLGDAAAKAGTRIAIEPNGAAYGTNFLNRVEEADSFVRRVGHPAVRLNFDIGALLSEGDFDRVEAIAAQVADRIAHVHISEPGLAPAPASPTQAEHALQALVDAGYDGWYSLEMAMQPQPIATLEKSVARLSEAVRMLRPTSTRPSTPR
jgi:sugar phosphate isomerase/epimerase